jgi:hypothetical protein
VRRRGRHDERAPSGGWREYAFVTDEPLADGGDEPGETAEELKRGEQAVRVAVATRLSQGEGDAAVAGLAELLVSEWGPQAVSDEPLPPLAIAGLDAQIGVDVDAIHVDQAGTETLGSAGGAAVLRGSAVRVQLRRGDEVACRRFVEAPQRTDLL